MPLASGFHLGPYEILSLIGAGVQGIVCRALDLKLDREVAIKVLRLDLVADPERKRRFIQEAKAAAKLEHPNIGVVTSRATRTKAATNCSSTSISPSYFAILRLRCA